MMVHFTLIACYEGHTAVHTLLCLWRLILVLKPERGLSWSLGFLIHAFILRILFCSTDFIQTGKTCREIFLQGTNSILNSNMIIIMHNTECTFTKYPTLGKKLSKSLKWRVCTCVPQYLLETKCTEHRFSEIQTL